MCNSFKENSTITFHLQGDNFFKKQTIFLFLPIKAAFIWGTSTDLNSMLGTWRVFLYHHKVSVSQVLLLLYVGEETDTQKS